LADKGVWEALVVRNDVL